MEIGFHLSAEEHPPDVLLETATRAEAAGYRHATISDHYHPWTGSQGESPFVWTVLGALGARTQEMTFTTAVTCPTVRMHPAVVAHAAATTGAMMPGRFTLGLGSGENLNEHVTGERWPAPRERLEMLEEATVVIRRLLAGEHVAHRGRHYRVEDAYLFTRTAEPPPIHIAASGTTAASLAGRIADGLIVDSPDAELIDAFRSEGPGDRPVTAKLMVSWARDVATAEETVLDWWPVAAVGAAGADLRLPSDFESVVASLDRKAVLDPVLITDDVDDVAAQLDQQRDAGINRTVLHQIGPRQREFLEGPGADLARHFGTGSDDDPRDTGGTDG